MNIFYIKNNRGTSIVFAIIVLLVLSTVAAALFSGISSDVASTAGSVVATKSFGAAEGGLQFGAQAIQDDVEAAYQTTTQTNNGYSAVVYLDGGYNSRYAITGGSNAVRACFHKRSWNNQNDNRFATLNAGQAGNLTIWDFQQRYNLLGSRIKRVRILARARKSSNGGVNPTMDIQYSVNAGVTYANVGTTITVNTNSFTEYYREIAITIPANAWQFFMNGGGNNLRLRVNKLNTGNRALHIDWLAFELTLEVDSEKDPWFTGTYASGGSFPDNLGSGQITSVAIEDESSKIHLNYASQPLLRRLIEYETTLTNGNALANAIITYRGAPLTNPFNSVEELLQVPGMTQALYDQLKDVVTVYSWVNTEVLRPAGSRAPVNVNTAPYNVLRAIIRTEYNNNGNRVNNLANAIITRRAVAPFTSMHSTKAIQASTVDLQVFSGWIFNTSISGWNRGRKQRICNIFDGSFYNRGNGNGTNPNQNWITSAAQQNSDGTELCYYSNAFLITSTGTNGDVTREVKSIYGYTYNTTTYALGTAGSYKLPSYVGETPSGYWREER